MISRLLSTLQRWANWKAIAILAALFLLFNGVIIPTVSVSSEAAAPILDLKFWYTPQQAYQAISLYSPQARQAAAWMHLTIDAAYPIVYGLLLSLLLILLFRNAPLAQQRQLSLFPWRAVFADFLENIGLAAMFLLYPAQFSLLAWATAIFTALKWIQIGFSGVALFIGVLLLVLGKAKRHE
jgi:hypothetical protein